MIFPAPPVSTSDLPNHRPPALVENFVVPSAVIDLSLLVGTNDRVAVKAGRWIVLNSASTDAGNSLGAYSRRRLWAAEAVREIRSRTQLPMTKLATLLGVERRSLYLWMDGKPLAQHHEAKLEELIGLVTRLDRGDPSQTAADVVAASSPSSREPVSVDRLSAYRSDPRSRVARGRSLPVGTLLQRGDDTLQDPGRKA